MRVFGHIIVLYGLIALVKATNLTVIDFFGNGLFTRGEENKVQDYATLITKSRTNLQKSFTICSSVSAEAITSGPSFFQLFDGKNKPWVGLYLSANSAHGETKLKPTLMIGENLIRLTKHSLFQIPLQYFWYHSCCAISTETCKITIVINGERLESSVFEDLIYNLDTPLNLTNKLIL